MNGTGLVRELNEITHVTTQLTGLEGPAGEHVLLGPGPPGYSGPGTGSRNSVQPLRILPPLRAPKEIQIVWLNNSGSNKYNK